MLLKIFMLSFAIFLPKILLIPVFVILFALAGLLLMFITMGLMIISPLLAVIVSVSLWLSLAMIPMMIGIRFGFTARGHDVTGSYRQLVAFGALYGALEAIGYLLITLSAAVALILISSALPPAELLALLRAGDVEGIEAVVQIGILPTGILGLVSLLVISTLRAVILVPLAGASLGRDANGSPHTPLAGFGRGFVPLTALVCVSYILLPLLIMGVFALLSTLGFGDVLEQAMAKLRRLEETGEWSAIGWQEWLLIAGVWTCWLWVFCLQCAGAVLYFLKGGNAGDVAAAGTGGVRRAAATAGGQPGKPAGTWDAAPTAAQDSRALRKRREQLS